MWGIQLILLSLVFLTSACWEKAVETLVPTTPSDTTPTDNTPSDNNQIDAIDVEDITPTDGLDSDIDSLDSSDVENSPVVFVPLPENQDTPIGIPNLMSTLVTVSDTAEVATVLGEGLEPGATIQFTNTTALERESVSQTLFVERLAAVFFNFVEVVVDKASRPALAVEDASQPCQQPHTTCIQIDDDGVLPPTPLFNVQDSDSFNVNYVNLTTGEIGPVTQEKITTSALYFGQKLDSPYATSHNGANAIVQAASDGNVVEVGFDASSGLFKVRSGTLESDYSFARIPDEALDGLTQIIYHAPTQHFILMNREEVAIHKLDRSGDGRPFLVKKMSSFVNCHDLCFPTKVKIFDIEQSLDFEEVLKNNLEDLWEITSTGIYHDLRVNYIMEITLTVDRGMMGTLQANVGDLGEIYKSLNEVVFVSADEHFYEDGTPIRFNHAKAFDATGNANNLLVEFESDRGQKYVAARSFLPEWMTLPAVITPVNWEKVIDLQIIKEQSPGDDEPGQALALTADGLFPIAYNVFPKDGEEAFIVIDESKNLKLGKNLAKMVFDEERKLVFILDSGKYGDSSHDQKIIAIDVSNISEPQLFYELNSNVDPNHDGVIPLGGAMGKILNYQPSGLELLEAPNGGDGPKNFLYVPSDRLEGALVLNVSLETDGGGAEPQKSIKLITEPPNSNFEKLSPEQ